MAAEDEGSPAQKLAPYYEQDGVTIYHGDCRYVLPTLAVTADLMVTDPPYGIAWEGRRSMGGIAGDDGSLDIHDCIRLALARLRDYRHFYVFGPADLSSLTYGATAELVWDKGMMSGGNLTSPWGPAHERITFGVWARFPSTRGYGGTPARLRRGSVIRVPKQNNGNGARTHPTEKPVLLMRQLIESSSLIGETVLDPFMGSGSTLVAAQLEGRRAIGIEVDERWCEVAARRVSQGVLDFGTERLEVVGGGETSQRRPRASVAVPPTDSFSAPDAAATASGAVPHPPLRKSEVATNER